MIPEIRAKSNFYETDLSPAEKPNGAGFDAVTGVLFNLTVTRFFNIL